MCSRFATYALGLHNAGGAGNTDWRAIGKRMRQGCPRKGLHRSDLGASTGPTQLIVLFPSHRQTHTHTQTHAPFESVNRSSLHSLDLSILPEPFDLADARETHPAHTGWRSHTQHTNTHTHTHSRLLDVYCFEVHCEAHVGAV